MPTTSCTVTELHYREGSSDKFYRVFLIGNIVHVNWGRRGTAGQWQSKSLGSTYMAEDHATKQVYAKEAKGYVETGRAVFQANVNDSTLVLSRLFDQNRQAKGAMPQPNVVSERIAEKEAKEAEAF